MSGISEPIQCDICGHWFGNDGALKNHKKWKHKKHLAIIEMWKAGMKQVDIAKDLNVTEAYISQVLAPYKNKPKDIPIKSTLDTRLKNIENKLKRQEILLMALINEIRDNFRIKRSIPKVVKRQVWKRDGGKCIKCGSNKNIHYDHVIPYSKGGSNSVLNIQLLCESCNKTKSNKIE